MPSNQVVWWKQDEFLVRESFSSPGSDSSQIHSPRAPGRPRTSDEPGRLARVFASIRDTGLDLRLPVSLGWPESGAPDEFVVAHFPSAAHSAPCTHVDCLACWCSH